MQIAAGPGAIHCDDYQLLYSFASLKRLNRDRRLGLFYNSATSQPRKIVGANVLFPEGTTGLTKVVARLLTQTDTVDTLVFDSMALADSLLVPGTNTRIAFDLEDGLSPGDALVPYTVEVRGWTGSTPSDTIPLAQASSAFIQRDHSEEFGMGWWVAGYERLTPVGDSLLWFGGDGSARLYRPVNDSTWMADTRGRPDSITATGGSGGQQPDSAYYLDLASTDRAYLEPSGTGITGDSVKSWAFWIRPDTFNNGRFAGVIDGGGPNDHRSWWMHVANDGKLRVGLQKGTTGISNLTTDSVLTEAEWSFVVVDHDGGVTPSDDRVNIWINGVEQGITRGGAQIPATLTDGTGADFAVGQATVGRAGLEGDLGEFAIFDDLLGDSIASAWDSTGIDFSRPGLIAGYKWVNDLTDESSNGNDLGTNGTLVYDSTAYASGGGGTAPTGYVRHILGGGEVHFSASGRHEKTVDRNGNETRFNHSTLAGTETRLTSIELPTADSTAEAYRFQYNTTDSVLPIDTVQVLGADSTGLPPGT